MRLRGGLWLGYGGAEILGPAGAAAEVGRGKAESVGTPAALCERGSENLWKVWRVAEYEWVGWGCGDGGFEV